METRVIVADNARARIFTSGTGLHRIEEVEGFVHPEARWTNSDLSSDSAGRSVDQHGALESRTSPKEHEAEKFAHLLAEHLKDMHNQQHFDALVLIAPPHFLGLLHKQLPKPLDKLVSQTLDKDLTSCSIEKIIDAIHA